MFSVGQCTVSLPRERVFPTQTYANLAEVYEIPMNVWEKNILMKYRSMRGNPKKIFGLVRRSLGNPINFGKHKRCSKPSKIKVAIIEIEKL